MEITYGALHVGDKGDNDLVKNEDIKHRDYCIIILISVSVLKRAMKIKHD